MLVELGAIVTVAEFNKRDGMVVGSAQDDLGPGTMVVLTSVTRAGNPDSAPQLVVNGSALDLALDPVVEFYPNPQGTQTCSYYEHFREFNPKPFLSVAELDVVKIHNMREDELVCVTGYNVLRQGIWVYKLSG
jgi:hypothetical protein